MKNQLLIKYSAIILGFAVLISWTFILINDDIPEGRTEMTFHLLSEFIMAILCILGGYWYGRKNRIAPKLVLTGFAMMVYSSLNAVGYYAELGDAAMVFMLSAIGIYAIYITYKLLRAPI